MLTPAQQTALDYHLRQTNRLINEELIQELTDHYTDAINERMAHGLAFDWSLTDVQKAFGGISALQRMERQYNRITFRRYDTIWMQYIQQQGRWPHCLVPLFLFGVIYWTTLVDALMYNPWFGFLSGSILGLIIKFVQLVIQGGVRGKNFPYKAVYLATHILPIAVLLYGLFALFTYLNTWLPPFIYEATMSAWAVLVVTHTLSYSQFYQAVFKQKAKVS